MLLCQVWKPGGLYRLRNGPLPNKLVNICYRTSAARLSHMPPCSFLTNVMTAITKILPLFSLCRAKEVSCSENLTMVVTTECAVLMWGRGFYGTKAEPPSTCKFVASTWQDQDIIRDNIAGITERQRPTQTQFKLGGSCAKKIWFSSSELIAVY